MTDLRGASAPNRGGWWRLSLLIGFAFVVYLGASAWYLGVVWPNAARNAKRAFVLNPVNQPAILQACQTMLANPKAYPQKDGDRFPKSMPPAIASLGADWVEAGPDGVSIMFGRDFGLWAPAPGTAMPPPAPGARPLIPGLWYLKYPGN